MLCCPACFHTFDFRSPPTHRKGLFLDFRALYADLSSQAYTIFSSLHCLSWLGLVPSHLVIRIISTKLNISVSSVSQPVSPPPQMLMWFQDWEFFCKTIDSMIWCVIFIHFLLYYIYILTIYILYISIIIILIWTINWNEYSAWSMEQTTKELHLAKWEHAGRNHIKTKLSQASA